MNDTVIEASPPKRVCARREEEAAGISPAAEVVAELDFRRDAVTLGIDEDAYTKLVAGRSFTMGPTRLMEAL